VGLIGVFFLALLGIFGAAISRQLTDEFKAWTPWLINYLIRRAVRQLPDDQRKLREEEWRSHANEIPGEVGKLIEASGFLLASWKMSRGLADDLTYLLAKRAFDIAFTALQIFLLAPLFPCLSLLVGLQSEGPTLFHIKRHGQMGKTITISKFRTFAIIKTVSNPYDCRVTEVGKFLRRYHLDELPVLFNVVLGEISLVGPRPLRTSELKIIAERIPQYSRRKNVKPGIVGWAKVNGSFGQPEPTLDELQRELEYDLYYIDHRSFWFDLKILWVSFSKAWSY
jgi:lipopolysaccharide/colanic/teichoic acid biosynthesis glycosyltransferase